VSVATAAHTRAAIVSAGGVVRGYRYGEGEVAVQAPARVDVLEALATH